MRRGRATERWSRHVLIEHAALNETKAAEAVAPGWIRIADQIPGD